MNEALSLPERDQEHERVLGVVFDISPAQASVLSCLCRGTIVTGDELLAYTGAKSEIKVVVSRTRAKMRELGMDIHSKINVGYWMDAEDKERVGSHVDKFLKGA